MDNFDEARLRQCVAKLTQLGEGQEFFAWLFDYLGYDKPMEQNRDVALHGVWLSIRNMIPTRELVTIEHRELRNTPVTEELEKLCQPKQTTEAQQTQADLADLEPEHQPFHRRRMNL